MSESELFMTGISMILATVHRRRRSNVTLYAFSRLGWWGDLFDRVSDGVHLR